MGSVTFDSVTELEVFEQAIYDGVESLRHELADDSSVELVAIKEIIDLLPMLRERLNIVRRSQTTPYEVPFYAQTEVINEARGCVSILSQTRLAIQNGDVVIGGYPRTQAEQLLNVFIERLTDLYPDADDARSGMGIDIEDFGVEGWSDED